MLSKPTDQAFFKGAIFAAEGNLPTMQDARSKQH